MKIRIYKWRDIQGFRSWRTHWRIGDIQSGLCIPVVGTRYTLTITRGS